jgi:tetratricopeptide (TPR) repeat protein
LSGLASLLEKSLLQQREDVADESRFGMLGMIQEYALEQLTEKDQADVIQRRHAGFYLALAEKAQPGLTGAQQVEWLDRLEVEHDNLRAALRWSLQRGRVETASRLGGALWRFWQVRGYLSEGRVWLEKILEAARCTSTPTSARVQALHGVGVLAYEQGDTGRAQGYFEDCLALRRQLGDKRGIAASLNNLANIAFVQGDYARAITIYEESRTLWQELGDKWGLATCLNNLGLLAHYQGDNERARSFYEESRTLSHELGDRRGGALALNNLGDVARSQCDYVRAETLYAESLGLWRELGDKRGVAASLVNLGEVAQEQRDHARARAHYRAGMTLYHEVNETAGIAMCMDRLAETAGAQGKPIRAAQLFGAAQGLREAASVVLAHTYRVENEKQVAAVRAQLDMPVFMAAWNHGRSLTLDEAIGLAFKEDG